MGKLRKGLTGISKDWKKKAELDKCQTSHWAIKLKIVQIRGISYLLMEKKHFLFYHKIFDWFFFFPIINHWIFFGTDSGWKNTFLLLKIGAIMYACFLTVTLIIFLLVFKLNNTLCHVNIPSSRSVSAIIKWMFCGCERQLGLGGASKLSLLKM